MSERNIRRSSDFEIEKQLLQAGLDWDNWARKTAEKITPSQAIEGLALRKKLIELLNVSGERRANVRKSILSGILNEKQKKALQLAQQIIKTGDKTAIARAKIFFKKPERKIRV